MLAAVRQTPKIAAERKVALIVTLPKDRRFECPAIPSSPGKAYPKLPGITTVAGKALN
jgi:hypothetical protein